MAERPGANTDPLQDRLTVLPALDRWLYCHVWRRAIQQALADPASPLLKRLPKIGPEAALYEQAGRQWGLSMFLALIAIPLQFIGSVAGVATTIALVYIVVATIVA